MPREPHARRAMLSRVRVDPGVAMICAWCHAPISRGRAPAGFECNYGMCRACVEERIALLEPISKRVRRRSLHPLAAEAPPAPA